MPPLSDPFVPGLAAALDGTSLIELLSEAYSDRDDAPEFIAARPVDVQYTPGQRCVVLHEMRLRVPGATRTSKHLIHAVASRAGCAPGVAPHHLAERYQALRESRVIRLRPALPTPVLHLPRASLEVRAFPYDPHLPTLIDAVHPATSRAMLSRAWRPRRRRVVRVAAEVLDYTPEARIALELTVLATDSGSGLPEIRHLVGKIHHSRPAARLFAAHWALWRSLGASIGLAPPVGWVGRLDLALQEYVVGTRLTDMLGLPTASKPVRKAAWSIAQVHRLRLPLPTVRDVDREADQCLRWAGVLREVGRGQARRVDALVAGVVARIEEQWRATGPVHADFHPANLIVGADRVYLLDWDQMAYGDPLTDVGRFLASLRVSALRLGPDPRGLDELADAFRETYLEATGADPRRIRLYEAASLITAAASPFRLQRPGWEDAVELLLGEAERAAIEAGVSLGRGARAPATPVRDARRRDRAEREEENGAAGATPQVADLTLDELLAWALEPNFLLASLVPLLRETEPTVESLGCTVEVVSRDRCRAELAMAVDAWAESGVTHRRLLAEIRPGHRRSSALRRLERVREAGGRAPGALRLPRPIGVARAICATVVEPEGRSGQLALQALRGDGTEPAARIARALAALTALPVRLGKARPVSRAIAHEMNRVLRAELRDRSLSERGLQLAAAAAASIGEKPEMPSSVLVSGLSLWHMRLTGDEVVADAAWDAQEGDSLLVAGPLVAEAERELGPEPAAALARACSDYLGVAPARLAAWAALELVADAVERSHLAQGGDELLEARLGRASRLLAGRQA